MKHEPPEFYEKLDTNPDPPAVVEDWYHRICSQCHLDSVYIYPEGQGPLPMWPEPCLRCGWVPGSEKPCLS